VDFTDPRGAELQNSHNAQMFKWTENLQGSTPTVLTAGDAILALPSPYCSLNNNAAEPMQQQLNECNNTEDTATTTQLHPAHSTAALNINYEVKLVSHESCHKIV